MGFFTQECAELTVIELYWLLRLVHRLHRNSLMQCKQGMQLVDHCGTFTHSGSDTFG
ncbi:hypothetical protein C8R32_103184 [Nitrosospira sp. Nsp5]|uniref:Transposase n=1 Tax=Nitrosospira multiformis TaxID=1231 RepID=A0ABY0T5P6_9PROT|nr:hypothetical protein C8R32_103184 [Nitrosospira sp. Nsp5]SDQ27252.1 hypothetical protein SAMN05216402_0127 [Nitrosospira multiformis]